MRDAIDQFRSAIQSAGLIPPDMIEPDGKLHRFASNGTRGDDAGWYALHGDGIPAGSFGDWRSGQSHTWRADLGRTPTPAEDAAHRAKVEAMRRERAAEKAREQTAAARKAATMWEAAKPAPQNHPYLIRKGIKPSGARLHNDALVIPVRSGGEIHSLQIIGPYGDKRFLTGGRVAGAISAWAIPRVPLHCASLKALQRVRRFTRQQAIRWRWHSTPGTWCLWQRRYANASPSFG